MKIGIAHAAFLEDRKASLDRLLAQLPGEDVYVSASKEPEHASIWARRLWQWAADQDEPVCLLNDDISVCSHLGQVCDAMNIAANRWPGPISLHTSVPEAKRLACQGFRFIRCYWLTGPGYILQKGDAASMIKWLDKNPQVAAKVNEDNVGIHWAFARQQPILGCIPALVQHDVSVKSTLGYDNHALRQTCVPWTDPLFASLELRDVNDWFPKELEKWDLPWLQNPWMSVLQMEGIRRLTQSEGPGPCCLCGRQPNIGINGMTFCEGCIKDMWEHLTLKHVAP